MRFDLLGFLTGTTRLRAELARLEEEAARLKEQASEAQESAAILLADYEQQTRELEEARENARLLQERLDQALVKISQANTNEHHLRIWLADTPKYVQRLIEEGSEPEEGDDEESPW